MKDLFVETTLKVIFSRMFYRKTIKYNTLLQYELIIKMTLFLQFVFIYRFATCSIIADYLSFKSSYKKISFYSFSFKTYYCCVIKKKVMYYFQAKIGWVIHRCWAWFGVKINHKSYHQWETPLNFNPLITKTYIKVLIRNNKDDYIFLFNSHK
jgi:hypothetical protein